MKLAIKLGILSALGLTFVAAACSDDEHGHTSTTSRATGTTTTVGPGGNGGGGSGGGGIPAIPALGAQIDRKGRPAVNTALNNTFTDDATRGMAEDAWNASANPADWGTNFLPDVRAGLAILDALNATSVTMNGCGDQAAYGALNNPDYATLATVLTNDYLVVKGDAADGCGNYLGVETGPDGLGLSTVDDCGGRTPLYDVIAVSYGALSGAAGFDDGIDVKPETEDAFNAGFPYLGQANIQ